MAGPQRKCANCRFFRDAGLPGNGWCTHPKRQLNSGVKILVRAGELACRNTWGGDLFQSKLDDAVDPAAADLPGDSRDDEVTSVTIPPVQPPAAAEDRVVSDRPAARRDLHDPNDAAHRDQDERARIMARGSADALAHARKRYTSRRQGGSEGDVVAGDDAREGLPDRSGDRVITHQARFSDRFLTPGGDRSPLRADPVPREEIARRHGTPADRFDTVPEVDPSFDLPGQRAAVPVEPEMPLTAASEAPLPAEPAPIDAAVDEVQLTSYEHVLQRARRIRASKQERMRPIRHADLRIERDVPPADEPGIAAQAWESELEVAAGTPARDYRDVEPWIAAYDDTSDDQVALSPDDDLGWDELAVDDRDWDNDEADWDLYDDVPVQHAPRRSWLSRLGLGRRAHELPYDDATVTRHAVALDADMDDVDDELPGTAWETPPAARERAQVAWADTPVDDEADLPAWHATEPIHSLPARNPRERRDPLPAWRRDAPEAVAAAVEAPAPVPVAESRAGRWMSDTPASSSTWHRQRAATELPDLDDNLFEASPVAPAVTPRTEAFARREPGEPQPDGVPARIATDVLQSRSPRDSYFRASRFQARHEEPTRAAEADLPAESPAGSHRLPDIDAASMDLRDVVARGGELLDMTIDIAPDIPRECRTCRSFRSADGGARGWCTNEWAFTHRRMVNEDDLACETSIGCWWLPADHYRLEVDDDIDQGPTPRMDELIARNRPAARRASGE